jgi:hypothetical protein
MGYPIIILGFLKEHEERRNGFLRDERFRDAELIVPLRRTEQLFKIKL